MMKPEKEHEVVTRTEKGYLFLIPGSGVISAELGADPHPPSPPECHLQFISGFLLCQRQKCTERSMFTISLTIT